MLSRINCGLLIKKKKGKKMSLLLFKSEHSYSGYLMIGGILFISLGIFFVLKLPTSDLLLSSLTFSLYTYGITIVIGLIIIGITTKSKVIKRSLLLPLIVGAILIIVALFGMIFLSIKDTITAVFTLIGVGFSFLMAAVTLETNVDNSIESVLKSLKEIKKEFDDDC
jgi:predicted MFS family arabinose efflux permease